MIKKVAVIGLGSLGVGHIEAISRLLAVKLISMRDANKAK